MININIKFYHYYLYFVNLLNNTFLIYFIESLTYFTVMKNCLYEKYKIIHIKSYI